MTTFDEFRVAAATAGKFLRLQLRGLGAEGDDDTRTERVDNARTLAQLGVAVLPGARRALRALGWRDGDDVTVLKLWAEDVTHDPALAGGETRVFADGQPKVCIRLLGGFIEVRVGVPDNELRLGVDATGYAGKSVARVDDEVLVGTLSGTAPPGGGPVAFIFTPAGGAPGGAGPTATITAKVGAGAPKVKA